MLICSMAASTLPSNSDLSALVVNALKALGGSGSNDQIRLEVIRALKLPQEDILRIHSGKRTVLEYKLAWARTIAKQRHLIQSIGRMNWKLTSDD